MEASVDRPLLGDWTLAEVIFQMLRFRRGSFAFTAEDHPIAVNGQPEKIETTITQATRLLEEWFELEAVVPSLNHRVMLASELSCEKITIEAEAWGLLVAITRRPAVAEIARRLKLGELRAMRAISRLVTLGVAVVEPPEIDHAPQLASGPETGEEAAVIALAVEPATLLHGNRSSA